GYGADRRATLATTDAMGELIFNRAPSGVTTDRMPAGPSGRAAVGVHPAARPRARQSPGPQAWLLPSGVAGGACARSQGIDSGGDQRAGSLAKGDSPPLP